MCEWRTYPKVVPQSPPHHISLKRETLQVLGAVVPPVDTCEHLRLSTRFVDLAGESHARLAHNPGSVEAQDSVKVLPAEAT